MRHPAPALLALAAYLLITPTIAAAAGSYQVSACNYAEGTNNSWTWSSTDSHYAEHVNCPDQHGGNGGTTDQEGGLSTTDALELSSGAPPGSNAAWTFTAPTGTTITAITYERDFGHSLDPDNYWVPALRTDGTIIDPPCPDTVTNAETCFIGGPPNEGVEPATITGLSAHQLAFGIVCQAPTGQQCVTGATEHSAWAAMYGATVTLNDPTPPTLNTPTGTLWKPGQHNGYHEGTETVQTSAQDTGSGVQSITLAADGHTIETYTAPCNHTLPQPCPTTTEPQTLTLPTTNLTDGTHTLTLLATDAAGNQSTIASQQITVDNNPPPPPTELTATPTQTGSTTFTATWADPPGQVAPITSATYQVCPANSPGTCGAPTPAPPEGPATITMPGPGNWSLAVWLTNAAGNNSTANAAHITLTVPADKPSSQGSGEQGQGSGPSGSHGGSPPQAAIRLSEMLRGRELIVHVSGPARGEVHIRVTAKLHGRTVFSRTRTITLRYGRLTTTFRLEPHTATHATIRVSAKLDHELAVANTLRRHTAHRGR